MAVNAQTNYRAEADAGQSQKEVQAKQGTDKPRGMPIVLVVSTVGAAVVLWAIWSMFFA